MSARTIIVIVLALVCGLCAAVGIQGIRRAPIDLAARPAAPVAMESVVVVAAPISQGEVIKADQVELREVPKGSAPPGVLNQPTTVVGRRAQIPMVQGDTLTERMLIATSAVSLGTRVQAGWRAFTIQAAGPSSSLAGSLERGDHVDVLFTRTAQAGPGGQMVGSKATILLQNVEILAVNPKDDNAIANKVAPIEVLSATLSVRPQDAAILDQAQSTGVLHLALRGREDKAVLPPPEKLASRVEAGKRAFTIQTQSFTAMMAGFLLPGDCVDVLHTPKTAVGATGSSGLGETRTILEVVRVLAIHTRVEQPSGNQFEPVEVQSVTLLVDPQEAEILEQSQNSGTIGLSLRNPKDIARAPVVLTQTPVDYTQKTRTLRGTRYGTDRFTMRAIPLPESTPGG